MNNFLSPIYTGATCWKDHAGALWPQTVLGAFNCPSWKDQNKHSFDFNKCLWKTVLYSSSEFENFVELLSSHE